MFEDLQCLRCFKVVELSEAKEMFSHDEYGKIEDDQMQKRIELDKRFVRCDCSCVIMFEPSKPDYK